MRISVCQTDRHQIKMLNKIIKTAAKSLPNPKQTDANQTNCQTRKFNDTFMSFRFNNFSIMAVLAAAAVCI